VRRLLTIKRNELKQKQMNTSLLIFALLFPYGKGHNKQNNEKRQFRKMSYMRLLAMYHAYKARIEGDQSQRSLPMMNLYSTCYKVGGTTGSTGQYKEV
jgi:ABC-type enterochelin transport system ATPase subunit